MCGSAVGTGMGILDNGTGTGGSDGVTGTAKSAGGTGISRSLGLGVETGRFQFKNSWMISAAAPFSLGCLILPQMTMLLVSGCYRLHTSSPIVHCLLCD